MSNELHDKLSNSIKHDLELNGCNVTEEQARNCAAQIVLFIEQLTDDRVEDRTGVLRRNIASLLRMVGDPSSCKGCGAPIWWVKHNNGKKAPYTAEGLNHFIDCTAAQQFKKGSRS